MNEFSVKEIPQKKYRQILKEIMEILGMPENCSTNDVDAKQAYFHGMLTAMVVSYCQPDIKNKRLSKVLGSLKLDNLQILEFLAKLKEIKESIEREEGENNDSTTRT